MSEAGSDVNKTTGTEGRARPKAPLTSIGELVRELQSEFPDLSISKVRYLEDRGLVSPQRTKGKYRKYSRADMGSLRAILAMQRDEYLPLDVIRQRLGQGSCGPSRSGAAARSACAEISLVREEPTYSLEQLCERLGTDEEFVLGLSEFKLVERTSDSGPAFTESDLDTAFICQRLSRFQVEPRHLRVLSSAAEREAGLIEQVVTPSLRSGHADKREYGLDTLRELGSLLAQLTGLLLSRELRRIV